MPSHNSKYYKKSLKRNKVVSKTLDKFLKRKRDDNRCTQQAESSTFLQECSENDTHVISEDGSSSELAMETTITTTPVQLSQPATQTAASDPASRSSSSSTITTTPVRLSQPATQMAASDSASTSSSSSSNARNDLRTVSIEQQQQQLPDFYYCVVGKGWFCRTCTSFSGISTPGVPYVTTAGIFGDHRSRRSAGHLQTERHKEAAKNKQSYAVLARRRTDVWKMLQEASLATEIQKTNTNRFVLKSFFRITHLLVKQNWAHSHNFKNLVDLVAECGGKELKTHLLTAPQNATYISPPFVAKFIEIIDNYIKAPLLASLKAGKYYTLYNDETQDISSVEQMVIYATFEHNNRISEHYVGIMPISQMVGSHLSAPNILEALNKFLQEIDIYLTNGRFFVWILQTLTPVSDLV